MSPLPHRQYNERADSCAVICAPVLCALSGLSSALFGLMGISAATQVVLKDLYCSMAVSQRLTSSLWLLL